MKDPLTPSDVAIGNYVYYVPPTGSLNIIIGDQGGYDNKPFATMWTDAKTDILYTSNEILNAAGISGNITRIGFNFQMVQVGMNGFKIKMAHTQLQNLNGGLVNADWKTVYSTSLYQPPGTGWQFIDFQMPFEWNGIENILIEICFDNSVTSGTGSNVYFSHTSGVTMYSVVKDNSSGCDLANNSGSPFAHKLHPNLGLKIYPNRTPLSPILSSPQNDSFKCSC